MKNAKLRTCVGCGEKSDKKAFLRVVRTVDNKIAFDETGKTQGRGAYVCADEKCIELVKKKRSLYRALKIEEIPADFYDSLKEHING